MQGEGSFGAVWLSMDSQLPLGLGCMLWGQCSTSGPQIWARGAGSLLKGGSGTFGQESQGPLRGPTVSIPLALQSPLPPWVELSEGEPSGRGVFV